MAGATDHDAEARRITDLYIKAVEQLGSDKAPVRLGGLYALERLAQDQIEQRQTIVNVICAYLRMPYTLPGDDPALVGDHQERLQEREVRLAAQRILCTHLLPGVDFDDRIETFWEKIDLDLTGASLIDMRLTDCCIRDATFRDATFIGDAAFRGAVFNGDAVFSKATFTDTARFSEVTFNSGARFKDTTFANHAWSAGPSSPETLCSAEPPSLATCYSARPSSQAPPGSARSSCRTPDASAPPHRHHGLPSPERSSHGRRPLRWSSSSHH